MDIFDLTATPELIGPAYDRIAVFAAIGFALLGSAAAILWRTNQIGDSRFRKLGWRMLVIGLATALMTAWTFVSDTRHTNRVREAVEQKRFFTLEGCLERFRPGRTAVYARLSGERERWILKGREFSYGSGSRFIYRQIEPNGGIVHADSWVKVSFVPGATTPYEDIVRLETKRVCPHAPNFP